MNINFIKSAAVLAVCTFAFVGQSMAAETSMTKIVTDQAPAAPSYSQGIRAGDFIFIAGQIGMDKSGVLVGQTIEEQTVQALKNVEAVLAAEGLTFDNVVRSQVFIKDVKDFATMNTLYMQAFTGDVKPVRTTVVTQLPKDALIEIECTAYAPQKS